MTTEPKEKTSSRDLEHDKVLIDFFKHQTTLCTATIVLIMAIVGTIFPQPMSSFVKTFVGFSAIFFLCSLGAAFMALVDLNVCFKNGAGSKEWKLQMVFTFISFMIGLLLFMITIFFG